MPYVRVVLGPKYAVRCTVHKHRNLLGHAPKHMHDELTEDYRDMIYAETAAEIETRRTTHHYRPVHSNHGNGITSGSAVEVLFQRPVNLVHPQVDQN